MYYLRCCSLLNHCERWAPRVVWNIPGADWATIIPAIGSCLGSSNYWDRTGGSNSFEPLANVENFQILKNQNLFNPKASWNIICAVQRNITITQCNTNLLPIPFTLQLLKYGVPHPHPYAIPLYNYGMGYAKWPKWRVLHPPPSPSITNY